MGSKYTIVRLSVAGDRFEVMVNPDAALDFKRGKSLEPSEVLVTPTIFTDANKGMRVSDEKLENAFQSSDVYEIAKTILRKGQLQLTIEQRRRLVEEKKKQIIDFISRRSIDPRTGLPHPPIRIEQAINQIHVSIDPFINVEEQAKQIIESLRPILPIRVEHIRIAIKIPPEYAPRTIGVVKNFGDIKQQEWQSDGSWIAIVEMTAGLHSSFLEKLEKTTRGNHQTKILK